MNIHSDLADNYCRIWAIPTFPLILLTSLSRIKHTCSNLLTWRPKYKDVLGFCWNLSHWISRNKPLTVQINFETNLPRLSNKLISYKKSKVITMYRVEVYLLGLPISRLILDHSTLLIFFTFNCGNDSFKQIWKSFSPWNKGL